MHLKKIVTNGFKSFADKITVTLDPDGITGIVGPNGSGKSNVIDAVRWVMGEQNAKNLRGEKATDIIFAGSDRRKPLGMAEVSLVFDNQKESVFCPAEYRHEPEISLTRRIYADGQREYMINRKPCRLKDIVGFFASTGLGGKSYSMIQQGQVEQIVRAKPEELREIIEEAAGTQIFKKRKQEAMRKFEQTQLNLSRIDDILTEVHRQIASLQNQVEKAKKYKEYSGQLKEDELALFAHNFAHFDDKQKQILEGMEKYQNQEIEAMKEISVHEVRHTELQSQMDEADPEIQVLQEAISVLREQIARAESNVKGSRDRIAMGTTRLEEMKEEATEDDANLRVLESQVEAARKELDAAQDVATELRDSIDAFQEMVEQADESSQVYQNRTEEFEDEIRNLERLIEANKFKSESTQKELDRAARETALENTRKNVLTEELATAKIELLEAEAAAGSKQKGLDKELREKHEREASIAAAYNANKLADANRDELRAKYHEVRARYTSLKELAEGATDVAGSFAKIKEKSPDAADQALGLLTDFISFTEEADELPPKAKAALERWCERLVVENFDHFSQLVRGAAQVELGTMPVSVLSLGESIDHSAAETWANQVGAEKISTYLKIDDKNAPVGQIIERLYLLTSLAADDETLKTMPAGVVLFTSQGVSYSGQDELVVGGANTAGLLSRKIEMEELATELKAVEGQLAKVQIEVDQLGLKINEDRQFVAEIDARLQAQHSVVGEVKGILEAARKVADHKQELLDNVESALEELAELESKSRAELEDFATNTASLSEELQVAKDELQSIIDESGSLIERRDELRRQHGAKSIDLAKSEARAQALRDGYTSQRAQLDLLQNRLSRRYEERNRIESDIEQAKILEAQATQDIEQFVIEREAKDEEYSSKREANSGLITELRELDNLLRKLREDQSKAQRSINEKTVQLERVKTNIEAVAEQAQEKYHLDIATYEFERIEGFNVESKTRSVQRLRQKIESMGDINMMALNEYEEKTERAEFMTRQRQEVLSSMELLEAAIMEIEESSERKFMEIFAKIRDEFEKLFPILFPGGEGYLELTNSDTPLDGGVEILCRLPGKSRKPMSLFSGGEKALTAISLIFALLKTKPTPFCFLDEVDAPLDETNVGRYNRVLEALAEEFQFIVITHNRRTMEVLDTLYGVTMQEPGVSKVVGVDMQKDLPPHLRKAFKDDKKKAAKDREVEGASAGA